MESQQTKIIRKPEATNLIGLSNTTFYRQIENGLIPPSFSLGCRAVGWYEHEIQTILRARAAGKSEDDIRLIVSELISARKQSL